MSEVYLFRLSDCAQVNNLQPGSWYKIRVLAHSPAGDTVALYKAATHTINGGIFGTTRACCNNNISTSHQLSIFITKQYYTDRVL